MIPSPDWRAPHAGNPNVQRAPNAALLIDFDNVTMAIRSDLGKELKALLNSEVIRGKVSVQRAYADWRRYPQYIVPLAESSIDLIFAPAYGSSKKNATDLRMAIDAIELVFTRPEIGTYILLTGDSDFSSCVLKLKEYGKYVIGVGMRESSSDLLIQNCDEYYSYHALSGLTRADEVIESKEDPWQLVRRATQQMVANRDVMRTDRLKQVMLTLDPAFDEKKLGYSKFSRFVQEAATKGMLQLKKMENGQLEIVVDGVQPAAAPAERERTESPRSRRGENGRRGRRAAPEPPRERPAPTIPVPAPIVSTELEAEMPLPGEAAPATAPLGEPTDLHGAYALLQQAVAGRDGKWVRDGDVKRRMLELSPDFDESKLGFPKFSRFLRQAHDAEIIDLNRVGTGHYEVALSGRTPRLEPPARREAPAQTAAAATMAPDAPSSATPTPAPQPRAPVAATSSAAAETPRHLGALRGRRGSRGIPVEGPPPLLPGQVIRPPGTAVAEPAPERLPATPEVAAPAVTVSEMPTAEAPAAPEAVEQASALPTRRGRGRRGSRSAAATGAPPEILPGQIVEAPAAPVEAAVPTIEPEAEAEAPAKPRRRSRSRTRKAAAEAPVETQAEAPAPEPVPEPAFSAAALGLARDPESITAYLSNSYRGIGKKTAEALLDAFGTDLFQVMHEEPERVRTALGDRRAGTLLEQWPADYERRMQAATPTEEASAEPAAEAAVPEAEAEPAEDEQESNGSRRGRPRSRRGGRGRTRKKRDEPAST